MEARRLRVPELRDELGRRGLDTRGLKAELAERLQTALDGEGARRGDAEGRYGLDNHNQDPQGGYNNPQVGYQDPQGGYQDPQGGYQDHQDPQGGYQDPQGGYQDPQGGYQDRQGYQAYEGQEAERRALEQETPRLPPDLKPPDSRPAELAPTPAPPPNYPVPPPPTFPTPPYGLPPPGYAPHPNYNTPPPNYNAPSPNYNAPHPNFNAPPPNFNAPPPNFNAPPPNFSAPPPNYNTPPPNYATPPPNYATPPPNYATPPPNYHAPPPNYNAPPPNYTSPPPNYSTPPPNYPAPPPNYTAPPFPAPPPVFGGGPEPAPPPPPVFGGGPEPAPPPPGRKRPLEEQRGRGGHEQRPEKRPRSPEPPAEDDEEEFDDSLVTVDTYNCDLHFKVARDRYSGHPLTIEGFAYLWSGARATHGATQGRVCFEIKVTEALPVQHLPPSEPDPHVVRVGWSLDCCSTQLGEEPFSYGYGGTGRKSTEGKFQSYGESFGESDVIACLADFEAGESVELSFLKNGRWQGPAFRVPRSSLRGRALFPHVLVKNCAVEFNFGQRERPLGTLGTLPPGYRFIQQLPAAHRERGTRGPRSRAECEILMMVGLPAAGKTTWAVKHAAANPDKKYNILGTNAIMDKMRVMGLKRQRNYAGRWDVLIQQATQCLNRLIQIAARKRRNYILDQTNVYGSAQRRKMRPFAGFQRRAVVICPTDPELRQRTQKRTHEEGKDVPEHAVLEMKANFTLPEAGEFLDSVQFVELQRDEAAALVRRYNQEGRSAAGADRMDRPTDRQDRQDRQDRHTDRQDRHTEPFRGRPSATFRGRGLRGAGSGNGFPRGGFPPPLWGTAPPPPPALPLPPPPPQPSGGFQSPGGSPPRATPTVTYGQGQQFPPSWQQLPQGPPWPFLGSFDSSQ